MQQLPTGFVDSVLNVSPRRYAVRIFIANIGCLYFPRIFWQYVCKTPTVTVDESNASLMVVMDDEHGAAIEVLEATVEDAGNARAPAAAEAVIFGMSIQVIRSY